MGRDVRYCTFNSKEDIELYLLRTPDYCNLWKKGTTEEQKRKWEGKFSYYVMKDIFEARNCIPYMCEMIFSAEELKDYIRGLVEEGDFKAVKWLAHIADDMSDYVLIDSC